jgi:hypothetical protein
MITAFIKPLLRFYLDLLLSLLLATSFMANVQAKSDHHDPSPTAASGVKGDSKNSNDKDIVLQKNAQSTLYLLSGWGRVEEPYVWYTVSAYFYSDQMAPNGKLFNLFSLSAAQDCKENQFFFYRVSYMFFDAKTKSLREVFFNKSKSSLIPIELDTIESRVKSIICN